MHVKQYNRILLEAIHVGGMMKEQIPAESYWKLRAIVLERGLAEEKRAHIGRVHSLLQNASGFINELDVTMREFSGLLEGAVESSTAKYNETQAEIGGAIGMEGKPEEWHVELVDEASSFMRKE